MATADVARLRFILSADSGGLKAGCKEGVGSLKDMSSQAGQALNRMDSGSIDWKGLKKSARSLKFVGRELGGVFKGGLGDVMGVASAGIGMGKLGGAMAVGAIGTNMVMEHFAEERRKQEEKQGQAFSTMQGAREHGIGAAQYRELEQVAAGDTKYLSDMANAMKQLADAGPGASEALKSLGKDIKGAKAEMGLHFKGAEKVDTTILANAGEERMKRMGMGRDSWGGIDSKAANTLKQHMLDKYMKQGMTFEQGKQKLKERMGREGIGSEGQIAEWETDVEAGEKKQSKRAELLADPSLKTNKEKLTEKLHAIGDTQKDIDADKDLTAEQKASYREKTGRATKDALDDYQKAQGGPAGMAGAATAGSAEAYSVIAGAQMGAASDSTAETNAILQAQFPELIQAVKGLNPNWRKADSAT